MKWKSVLLLPVVLALVLAGCKTTKSSTAPSPTTRYVVPITTPETTPETSPATTPVTFADPITDPATDPITTAPDTSGDLQSLSSAVQVLGGDFTTISTDANALDVTAVQADCTIALGHLATVREYQAAAPASAQSYFNSALDHYQTGLTNCAGGQIAGVAEDIQLGTADINQAVAALHGG